MLTKHNISDVFFSDVSNLPTKQTEGFDYVIYYLPMAGDSSNRNLFSKIDNSAFVLGKESSLYILNSTIQNSRSLNDIPVGLTLLPIDTSHFPAGSVVISNPFYIARSAMNICFAKHRADMVLLKYETKESSNYANALLNMDQLEESDNVYDFFGNYNVVYFNSDSTSNLISSKGTRGKLILRPYPENLLITSVLDDDTFELTTKSHEEILPNMYADSTFIGSENFVVEHQ
jgi:hypothetical protein